jgi:hypothetical protein
MPPENRLPWSKWLLPRIAMLAWLVILSLIVVRVAIWPQRNNCFVEHYRPAGQNWLHGVPLYSAQADTCRYSPLMHALLAPFTLFSERYGSVIWRALMGLTFLGALLYWVRAACQKMRTDPQWPFILLCALPLSIGSLNNGQGNVPMAAAILIGTAAICQKRWNLAAAAFAMACLVKIYPIALVLLLIVVCSRQFALRFAIALSIGLLLPFVLQNPGYVAEQYERWAGNLQTDDRSAWDLSEAYRDVWLLIRITGLPLDAHAYRLVQIGTGCLIGLLCLWMSRRDVEGCEFINRVVGLGCCWMTAFGPATESPTYILLSAPLAWLLVGSWGGALPKWTRLTTTAAAILFFGTVIAVALPFGRAVLARGPQPAAALLVLATLVLICLNTPAREANRSGTGRLSTDRGRQVPNGEPAARENAA